MKREERREKREERRERSRGPMTKSKKKKPEARRAVGVGRMGASGDLRIHSEAAQRIDEVQRMNLDAARVSQAAAAGVSEGRLDLEALWLLPDDFRQAYEELFHRTFRDPGTVTTSGLDEDRILGAQVDPKAKRRHSKVLVEISLARVQEQILLKALREKRERVQSDSISERGQGLSDRELSDIELTDSEKKRALPSMGDLQKIAKAMARDPLDQGAKARVGGRRHREHWTVVSQESFDLKRRVDSELRALADLMKDHLGGRGGKEEARRAGFSARCRGCGKFGAGRWSFCAWCGESRKKMERE